MLRKAELIDQETDLSSERDQVGQDHDTENGVSSTMHSVPTEDIKVSSNIESVENDDDSEDDMFRVAERVHES